MKKLHSRSFWKVVPFPWIKIYNLWLLNFVFGPHTFYQYEILQILNVKIKKFNVFMLSVGYFISLVAHCRRRQCKHQ